MPYSFTQIEKDKSRTIGCLFAFLIGIYFLAAWGIGITLKNAFTFFASDYYFGKIIFLSFPEILAILLLAFLVGAAHWTYTTSNLIPKILGVLKAEQPESQDHYHGRFLNILAEVSVATGGMAVEGVVIPTSAMNAFALQDFDGRAIIGVTEGLLARLSRAQLEAVVGHEAAHVVSGDSLSKTVAVSLFSLYSGMLSGLKVVLDGERNLGSRRADRGLVVFVTLYAILSATKLLSRLVAMFISRQREFRADAVSVRLTRDPLALAEALYGISRYWRGGGLAAEELEAIFIVNPAYHALDEETGVMADLFSTHPPLESRLKILLDMAHADVNVLQKNIEKQEIRPRITVEDSREPRVRYMVHQEGKWTGPFDLAQLPLLQGLQPGTWIERLDEENVKMASEDPLLTRLFQNSPVEGAGCVCPKCRITLVPEVYEGTELLRCGFCRGILVHESNVQRIIIREDAGFSEQIRKMAEVIRPEPRLWGKDGAIKKDPKTLYVCPQCRRPTIKMVRMFYTVEYHVEIDKCIFCGMIWFDQHELEVLQCLIESAVKNIK